MGKRKKSSLQTNAVKNKITKLDDNTTKEAELTTIQVITKNKKVKSEKKNKINEENALLNNSKLNTTKSNSEIAESHRASKKKRKNNIKSENTYKLDKDYVVDNKLLINNDVKTAESFADESETYIKKKGKNEKVKPNREELDKGKEKQAVEIKEINIRKENKKPDLEQEDDVKDEDIDKFCEEIDEEDNLQYLNWVEQIEAKLNCNKKKPI